MTQSTAANPSTVTETAEELRTRYMKMAADEKLTDEWGQMKAEALWNSCLAKSKVSMEGKSFLDFGCAWGYLGKYLFENAGLAKYTGFDIVDLWNQSQTTWSWRTDPRVRFFKGDVRKEPAVQGDTFDVIFTFGTLFTIPGENIQRYLQWFYDHLNPGGSLIVGTHSFTSWCGGSLMRDISFPAPHLCFSREVLDAFLALHGLSVSKCVPVSIMTAGSYLAAFRSLGFALDYIGRSKNKIDSDFSQLFSDRLHFYTPSDLGVSVLKCYLRKPIDSERAAGALMRLEALGSERSAPTPAATTPIGDEAFSALNIKCDDDWQLKQRAAAANLASFFGIPLKGKRILQFGCADGSFLLEAINHGAQEVMGFELTDQWGDVSHNFEKSGVPFHVGDVVQTNQLEGRNFDLIIALNSLDRFGPSEFEERVAKLYQLLPQGGTMLLSVRPWSSRSWSDIDKILRTPAPQLLFSLEAIRSCLGKRGLQFKQGNLLTAGTYVAMLTRVGFEIVQMASSSNGLDDDYKKSFSRELKYLPADEIDTNEVRFHLVRPWEVASLEQQQVVVAS